jgi:hypothetical protein
VSAIAPDPLGVAASTAPALERGRELAAQAGSEPLYGTPAWVAGILDITLAAAYRIAADPTCPVLRLGPGRPDKRGRVRGTLRFPRARFIAWLKGRESGGPGRPRRLAAVRRGDEVR